MELAFFIFKVIPYNISLSLTLGDGLGSCTTRGRNSPKPRWISHSSRLAQPPLEPLHQQQGPSQHPVLSQDWRNWNIKLLALISLAFAFFFFCFHSCFEFVTFYPFLATFKYFPLPPSHTLSLLACFRCCFTGGFGCKPLSFTANSWSSQITDYRAVSSGCLLLPLRVGKIIF